ETFRLELRIAVLLRSVEFFVEPTTSVLSGFGFECADDFPVIARNEFFYLLLAFNHDRERRRLHAANRRLEKSARLRVERGHRPRAVDADEPIGFGTAESGVGAREHRIVLARTLESFADRGRSRGL